MFKLIKKSLLGVGVFGFFLSLQFQSFSQTYSLGSIAGATNFDATVASNSASLSTCNCPTGSVVVGIIGNQGLLIDRFTIKCAVLNSNGTLGTVTNMTTYVGTSTGGTSFNYAFTGTTAMVGYDIRTGDNLDRLMLRGQTIAYIAAGSNNNASTTNLTAAGGSGGSLNTRYAPNGNVIVGVNFKNATYGGGLSFNYAPISSCSATAPTGINVSSSSICSGTSVTLTATGGTGSAYQWGTGSSIGSNSISGTGSTITVNPTSTTTYWVRRTQNSPCASTGGVTTTISVTAPATQPTSLTASSNSICSGSSVTLTANGGSGSTFQWGTGSVGSGVISGQTGSTLTVNPTSTTTYWVRRVQTSSPCTGYTNGQTRTITVTTPPTAPTGINASNSSICSGSSVTLTATGGTGNNYQWGTGSTVGSNAISGTGSSITVTPSTTTTYWVRRTPTSPCSGNTEGVTTSITVTAAPTAPTSISVSASTICSGTSVTLTANGGSGNGYQWGTGANIGSNTISGTGASITVSPTSTTTYWVRSTPTSPCSSNSSGVTNTVYVSENPTISVSSLDATVCPGGNTTLNASATQVAQVIAAQNFDDINTLGYTLSDGSISNSNSGNSGTPANAPYGENGSNGYAVVNNGRTITFNNITGLEEFTSKQIEFNLSALSTNGTNGLDDGDDVIVSVSTDNGISYSDELEIVGNNNATWTYATGTAIATVTYDGNDTPTIFAPTTGGQLTTQGYGTLRINLPDNMSQMRFRIEMDNDNNEVWAIDDIRITGIPILTYSWATTAAPSTVLATTQSTVQSPTTSTTYVATVTNATGCSASSQVSINLITPTLTNFPTSGDVIWRGANSADWNNASNWYNFDGTTYSVASSIPTDLVNVIIPANQTCVLDQPSVLSSTVNAAKNVLIESGATLTMDGGTLSVAGDWTNNGTFTGSTGSVSFNGSGTATLGGTSSTTFANLSMNKSGTVSLSMPVTVSGSLTLNNGIIDLGANNLSLGAATLTGGSATTFIKTESNGVLSRIVETAEITFPVGNDSYNPAVLSNNGASDVFSVRVIDNVTNNGTGEGTTTTQAVVKRTWMISEALNGGSSATVRLYWNGIGEEENGFDVSTGYVAHYSIAASMWENMGGSNSGGSIGSTEPITSFSPFTISSSLSFAPLPVELLSFDAQCANDNVIVRWTTASEHNSLNFTVQRSEEGTTWNDVQTVEAAGNSNNVLDYAIQDMGAARGVKYYRLIQTDQDGVHKIYGPIISNCGSEALSFLTFPNPSTDEFTMVFGSENINGDVVMTVSDAKGKVVRNTAFFIEKGTSSMMIPSLDLSPGVYQIQLTGDNFQSAIIKHSIR